MRPGQNKRMRGRNRRGPNPLTRSYESNGPDVKIRGTAAHVAEKYVSLARDAHASGDPVAAESYLQHAEHYLRLIAAAQQQQFQAQQAAMNGGRVEDTEDFDGEDEFESSVMDRFTFRAPQAPATPGFNPENGGSGEQPRPDYQPRMEHGGQEQPREQREFRRDRGDRGDRGERGDRGDRGEFRRERNFDRDRPQRFERPKPEMPDSETALPSFITAPVRIAIGEGEQPGLGEQPEVGDLPIAAGEEGGRFPLRPRRRRNRRGPRDEGGEGASVEAQDAPGE